MKNLKVNDTVKFENPMADEVGMTYKILEVNGDRVLMEAQNGMVILPTQIAQVSDLEVIS